MIRHKATAANGQNFTRNSKTRKYEFCVVAVRTIWKEDEQGRLNWHHDPSGELKSIGWCSRLDLAEKLAAKYDGWGHLGIEILAAETI